MYSQLDMFRVHTPIIRSIRCWVAAYGFLHRVFGWMVVLRAVAYGADGAVRLGTIRTAHTTYTAALKTTTHPKTRYRKPYAATQHLMLLMMGVCTGNMSSWEYINKITLLHQIGVSLYFMIWIQVKGFIRCTAMYFALCILTIWRLTTTIVVVPHHQTLNFEFYIFIQQI